MRRLLCLPMLVWLIAAGAHAHEARPGYLGLRETDPGQYDATWKQPANGEYAIRMGPQFPPKCQIAADSAIRCCPARWSRGSGSPAPAA